MFSEEEKYLLHRLGPTSRGQAMDRIRNFMNTIIDADYIRLSIRMLHKLEKMSDAEFALVLWDMEQRDL